MAGINKAIVIGNLGADPELRHTQSGTAVCNLRIATNETWNDRDGQKQERTEWHSVVVFGKQAENCNQYLQKGRQVYVEGRLQTRDWEDRDGNKRYTTEIVAHSVQFLQGGSSGGPSYDSSFDQSRGGGGGGGGSSKSQSNDNFNQSFEEDDIPF